MLTQSDMHACNFGVAVDGRPVVFDVATVQALPATLAHFTLLRTTKFAKDVGAQLLSVREQVALLTSPNFDSLWEVRDRLRMGTDDLGKFWRLIVRASLGADIHSPSTPGVDKDGNIKPKVAP